MELKLCKNFIFAFKFFVLIVLYGIETIRRPTRTNEISVLIVLYGIETEIESTKGGKKDSLNRTLWN